MQRFILSAALMTVCSWASLAADNEKSNDESTQMPPTVRIRNQNTPAYDPNVIAPRIQGEFDWPPRTYGGPTLDVLPPLMEFGGPGVEHRFVHASDYAHLLPENACPSQVAKADGESNGASPGEPSERD